MITLALYAGLVELGLWYPLAAVVGYIAGILNGYTWNRIWTFEAGPFQARSFSRYVAVQGSGLLLNITGLLVMVEVFGLGHTVAEIATLIPVTIMTFLVNRHWTFVAFGAPPARVQEKASSGQTRPSSAPKSAPPRTSEG